MIGWIREHWRQFKEDKPGQRFQDRYHRNQRRRGGRFSFRKIFNIVVGLAIAIVSLFFGWAPGPGTVTFFIGMGMIAGELLIVARLLDWAEVRLRKLAHFVARVWRASVAGKALIILLILVCVAALGYVVYFLILGSQIPRTLF
jgi:uncharacterized protein (TIGR02611 family)